ncbi:MAG: NDP-hexose 2,3-dehydratase family protein [Flammeovirgaceae bacterium]
MVSVLTTKAAMRDYLAATLNTSHFSIERINISAQQSWAYRDGVLSHSSNGFFHVTGLMHQHTQEEQLVLYQPQSALTGLALYKEGREAYVLLQARAEPGNVNVVQYGPTIQSTAANYLRVHGGKKTAYAELFREFSPLAYPLGHVMQIDLGKRYFKKSKFHSYVELKEMIPTEPNMAWVPLSLILDMAQEDNFLNVDLRSLLSVFDWDLFLSDQQVAPPPSDRLLAESLVYQDHHLGKNDWKLASLDQLSQWSAQDEGIKNNTNSGIWADMFQISCISREVSSWTQPLICATTDGLARLYLRKHQGETEFLVSVRPEFGVSGEVTILPSQLIYPGELTDPALVHAYNGQVVAKMTLCDEGGRFYLSNTHFQVVQVGHDFDIEEDQVWIRAATLKKLLKISNKVSIQLRCMSSLILPYLNPMTLAHRQEQEAVLV